MSAPLGALALLLAPPASSKEPFVDAAASSGLDFVHFNGMAGDWLMPEMMGPGGALLDYDQDGDLDVFLIQGQMLGPGRTLADALLPQSVPREGGDRLFRSDLHIDAAGRPALGFADVTDAAGVAGDTYGFGAASGDFDNDGWPDLYLTDDGRATLWRNRGDGRFERARGAGGAAPPGWSASASVLDYDRDGWLDLFVTGYVRHRAQERCFSRTTARDYCGPGAFAPAADHLFRNSGGGTFEEVSAAAGLRAADGPGLGSVAADFNGDGWPDLYVADDQQANQLWINRGGAFHDEALAAGCAVNRFGRPEASMGVVAADFDEDGDEDLFMTHLLGETNTLFVNDGTGLFLDRSAESGLGPPSLPFTGFGIGLLDVENDGWLDLFVANGSVRVLAERAAAGDPFPLDQSSQLFSNLGDGRFADATATAGPAVAREVVGRGVAAGDVDGDGDADLLLLANNDRARLLLNQPGARAVWVAVRVLTAPGGRDALGATVVVAGAAGRRHRRVATDGSYLSASDPRVLVGLGSDERPVTLEVRWPDGRRARWTGVPARHLITVVPPAGAGG